jgi:WD40 repeat protein
MKGSSFAGYAFVVAFLCAVAAGCSGTVPGSVAMPASSVDAAVKSSGALLYVLNGGTNPSVEFVTFPQGRYAGTLAAYGYPEALCSDTSGDVWVPFYTSGKVLVAEYAHASTTPVAKLEAPMRAANGCAVDPSSGDLAVLSNAGIDGNGEIAIWAAAKGKPKKYRTAFEGVNAAYDNEGNLFVDGMVSSSVVFEELPRGAKKLHFVAIEHGGISHGGSVQWDGTYIAVVGDQLRRRPIWRLSIVNFKAKIVQTVDLRGTPYQTAFWTNGSTIVATQRDTRVVGVWNYPTGGAPTKRLKGFHGARGVTVSVGRI